MSKAILPTREYLPGDRFLRLPEVKRRVGLSTSTIYRGMAAGTFPKSIAISEKIVAWTESSIADWQTHILAEQSK